MSSSVHAGCTGKEPSLGYALAKDRPPVDDMEHTDADEEGKDPPVEFLRRPGNVGGIMVESWKVPPTPCVEQS